MIPDGCIQLARKIQDSPIWYDKPSWWLKVWCHVLIRVNHKLWQGIGRGEGRFSREEIHESCRLKHDHVKPESVDNVLRWLKSTTQITTRKTTRGIVITVLNYDKYQNMDSYRNETQNETPNDTGTRQERDRNEMIYKNERMKETNKEEKKTAIRPDFLEFWERYGKKGNRAKAYRCWCRLKESDREEIGAALPGYVASTPDKQYRKNAETWLNPMARHWNDELVDRSGGAAKRMHPYADPDNV